MSIFYHKQADCQRGWGIVIVHLLVKLGYIKGNNRACERR
jgi:hypothetical protein